MRVETTIVYEQEDYEKRRAEIDDMSNDDLANRLSSIARGWLPDFSYTCSEDDFKNFERQLIVARVVELLRNADCSKQTYYRRV